MHAQSLSRVQCFVTPQTVARQAPLSMEFSRQGCWSGLLFPSPEDLPDPEIEPRSPALQADSLPGSHQGSPIPKPGRYLYSAGSPAAAATSLQSCPTLCDPIDGSPPGSAVLGFSRQEHGSGLPFPSPMHESEK